MLRRILALVICAALLNLPVSVEAESIATELTDVCQISVDGASASYLTDDNIYTYRQVGEVDIESDAPIYGLYIKFDRSPEGWIAEADGQRLERGMDGFLHEFVPLEGVSKLKLSFENKASIADIFLYGEGTLPDTVQTWSVIDKADIMICPTHSDDDQLYFAGMIPWCTAMGYDVQVVYFTNHLNTHDRPHELLDGLWHCGLKYYPYIPDHPDLYSLSIEEAVSAFSSVGISRESMVEFYVELFQRYKPLVVAGHDINGEYGHGVHMLNSSVLMEAVTLSAERGLWDVQKTYIHSLKENQITFNWDIPMEALGGKTPFEVSQEGYGFHHSQHRFESLSRWLYGVEGAPITKASQIYSHSPCSYGLYRSTVGIDTVENSLFENITTHKQQAAEQVPPVEEPPSEESEEKKEEHTPRLWGEKLKSAYMENAGEGIVLSNPYAFVTKTPVTEKGYDGNVKMAIIFGGVAFVFTLAVLIVVKKRKEKNERKNKA